MPQTTTYKLPHSNLSHQREHVLADADVTPTVAALQKQVTNDFRRSGARTPNSPSFQRLATRERKLVARSAR